MMAPLPLSSAFWLATPAISPARAGLTQAQMLRDLAQKYAEAQQAIAQADWVTARNRLEAIAAIYPSYEDVDKLLLMVIHQQEMEARFAAATAAYNASHWAEALSVCSRRCAKATPPFAAMPCGSFSS